MIQKGEIRHVKRNLNNIIKVIGPFDSEHYNKDGDVTKLDMFIQTNEFPKYHYIVILDIIESYTSSESIFFIAKLITHSSEYNNIKISEELYDKDLTAIDLTKSFITRDKFLIPVDEVQINKIYGNFDIVKLEDISEY